METNEKQILQKIAHTVRALAADAIEKPQSGHPGLPLGAAELGTYIYTKAMKHNPKNPDWMGRDRFVLSAGHGSMLLYSLLHLSGYDVTMDDIKNFRLLNSKTPGHPEFGVAPGVETTTGPLGQGVAAATGMAIAQKLLAAKFGKELFNSRIFVLAGDGCLMEGISAEAGSLAGTLGLDNLVIVYDSNDICLDGPTEECFTEDIAARYRAYGFKVFQIDGYHFDEMETAFNSAAEYKRPALIIAKTVIGKYTPNREGTSKSHGAFLGPEMAGFKQAFGWPETPFHVPDEVKDYFEKKQPEFEKYESDWISKRRKILSSNSSLVQDWDTYLNKKVPADFEDQLWNLEIDPDQPTRKYNEALIRRVAEMVPYLISGSADVASVDFTWLPGNPIVKKDDWNRQQIKFGVREFSMAACAYGMQLHGMVQPAVGTFLVFSDYMRNAVRISAMMKQRVIYVYTHDSILIGQDGPTHQPVEHLMSLRLMPNLTVLRPGDENEARAAWAAAFEVTDGPVAICFTRQPVKSSANHLTKEKAREGFKKGAYVLYGDVNKDNDIVIYASGSEINPAVKSAEKFEADGLSVCVVSVPCWELLDKQPEEYRKQILEIKAKLRVSVEAGVGSGWQKFVGSDGLIISQETYGESAPEPVMADHFGFTDEKVYSKINEAFSAGTKNVEAE